MNINGDFAKCAAKLSFFEIKKKVISILIKAALVTTECHFTIAFPRHYCLDNF